MTCSTRAHEQEPVRDGERAGRWQVPESRDSKRRGTRGDYGTDTIRYQWSTSHSAQVTPPHSIYEPGALGTLHVFGWYLSEALVP